MWKGIKETDAATESDKEWQKKKEKKTIAETTGGSLPESKWLCFCPEDRLKFQHLVQIWDYYV